jgi:kynurenine formamidase
MELIDLSREIFHRTQVHPSHPPVIMTVWGDHSEKKIAGNAVFSSKALSFAFSDHAGMHVDAPVHFDPRPVADTKGREDVRGWGAGGVDQR